MLKRITTRNGFLACARLSVSADKQQSSGAVKKASDLASEKQREDRGRTPVSTFLNNSVCTVHLPPPSFGTARETVSRVKMLNVKMCSAGGFHTLFMFV